VSVTGRDGSVLAVGWKLCHQFRVPAGCILDLGRDEVSPRSVQSQLRVSRREHPERRGLVRPSLKRDVLVVAVEPLAQWVGVVYPSGDGLAVLDTARVRLVWDCQFRERQRVVERRIRVVARHLDRVLAVLLETVQDQRVVAVTAVFVDADSGAVRSDQNHDGVGPAALQVDANQVTGRPRERYWFVVPGSRVSVVVASRIVTGRVGGVDLSRGGVAVRQGSQVRAELDLAVHHGTGRRRRDQQTDDEYDSEPTPHWFPPTYVWLSTTGKLAIMFHSLVPT